MINRIERPIISILMAVYNTEEFLQEAIDSVIEQTYSQWELICVNDGSTDNSLNILNQYQEKDPRIVVVDYLHCGTAAGARNAGLAIASGYYIAMLDSDDKIEPSYLEKLIDRQQESQADIVISSTNFWEYKNNKITFDLTGINGDLNKIISGREAFELSLDWKIGGIGLHHAETLKKIKYCETGMYGDEYTTRLLFLQANGVAFSNAIYFYRNNINSSTQKFSVKHFSKVIIQAKLLTLIRKNKLNSGLYIRYKEGVVLSLLGNYLAYLKKRKSLTPNEKKIGLGYIWIATIHVSKEFWLPPISIKSPFNIMYKVLKKLT